MKALRRTKTHEQHLLLSAPSSAALVVDESGLELPADRKLRILLIGTQWQEFLDMGQWFRFLPAMLGSSCSIAITACDVDPSIQRPSRARHVLQSRTEITNYRVASSA